MNGNNPFNYKICFNSENYELYKKPFTLSATRYQNIILETFILNNSFNKYIEVKVHNLLNKNEMLNIITEEANLKDFIKSEYMFFFIVRIYIICINIIEFELFFLMHLYFFSLTKKKLNIIS